MAAATTATAIATPTKLSSYEFTQFFQNVVKQLTDLRDEVRNARDTQPGTKTISLEDSLTTISQKCPALEFLTSGILKAWKHDPKALHVDCYTQISNLIQLVHNSDNMAGHVGTLNLLTALSFLINPVHILCLVTLKDTPLFKDVDDTFFKLWMDHLQRFKDRLSKLAIWITLDLPEVHYGSKHQRYLTFNQMLNELRKIVPLPQCLVPMVWNPSNIVATPTPAPPPPPPPVAPQPSPALVPPPPPPVAPQPSPTPPEPTPPPPITNVSQSPAPPLQESVVTPITDNLTLFNSDTTEKDSMDVDPAPAAAATTTTTAKPTGGKRRPQPASADAVAAATAAAAAAAAVIASTIPHKSKSDTTAATAGGDGDEPAAKAAATPRRRRGGRPPASAAAAAGGATATSTTKSATGATSTSGTSSRSLVETVVNTPYPPVEFTRPRPIPDVASGSRQSGLKLSAVQSPYDMVALRMGVIGPESYCQNFVMVNFNQRSMVLPVDPTKPMGTPTDVEFPWIIVSSDVLLGWLSNIFSGREPLTDAQREAKLEKLRAKLKSDYLKKMAKAKKGSGGGENESRKRSRKTATAAAAADGEGAEGGDGEIPSLDLPEETVNALLKTIHTLSYPQVAIQEIVELEDEHVPVENRHWSNFLTPRPLGSTVNQSNAIASQSMTAGGTSALAPTVKLAKQASKRNPLSTRTRPRDGARLANDYPPVTPPIISNTATEFGRVDLIVVGDMPVLLLLALPSTSTMLLGVLPLPTMRSADIIKLLSTHLIEEGIVSKDPKQKQKVDENGHPVGDNFQRMCLIPTGPLTELFKQAIYFEVHNPQNTKFIWYHIAVAYSEWCATFSPDTLHALNILADQTVPIPEDFNDEALTELDEDRMQTITSMWMYLQTLVRQFNDACTHQELQRSMHRTLEKVAERISARVTLQCNAMQWFHAKTQQMIQSTYGESNLGLPNLYNIPLNDRDLEAYLAAKAQEDAAGTGTAGANAAGGGDDAAAAATANEDEQHQGGENEDEPQSAKKSKKAASATATAGGEKKPVTTKSILPASSRPPGVKQISIWRRDPTGQSHVLADNLPHVQHYNMNTVVFCRNPATFDCKAPQPVLLPGAPPYPNWNYWYAAHAITSCRLPFDSRVGIHNLPPFSVYQRDCARHLCMTFDPSIVGRLIAADSAISNLREKIDENPTQITADKMLSTTRDEAKMRQALASVSGFVASVLETVKTPETDNVSYDATTFADITRLTRPLKETSVLLPREVCSRWKIDPSVNWESSHKQDPDTGAIIPGVIDPPVYPKPPPDYEEGITTLRELAKQVSEYNNIIKFYDPKDGYGPLAIQAALNAASQAALKSSTHHRGSGAGAAGATTGDEAEEEEGGGDGAEEEAEEAAVAPAPVAKKQPAAAATTTTTTTKATAAVAATNGSVGGTKAAQRGGPAALAAAAAVSAAKAATTAGSGTRMTVDPPKPLRKPAGVMAASVH